MAHIVIGHVIGTVTLLMMFFAIGNYYTDYFTLLSEETYQSQLTQVTSYLASNVIDLITLCRITPGDQFLVKQVEIPYAIGERLYNISLSWMQSPSGDFDVARISASIPELDQYVTMDLPYSNGSLVEIYSNESVPSGYLVVDNNVSSNIARVEAAAHDKATSLMIWCMKRGDIITVGFGVIPLN
jgi:hypothetical protein